MKQKSNHSRSGVKKKDSGSKSIIVQIRPSKTEMETFKYESLQIDSFWDDIIK